MSACPNCGAPHKGAAPPGYLRRCSYCNTEYQVARARGATAQPGKGTQQGSKVLGLALASLFAAGLVALVVWLRLDGASAQAESGRKPSAVDLGGTFGTKVGRREAEAKPAPTAAAVSPVPVEQKPVQVPATAEFTFHRTKAGYKTNVYVLGEVKNTSPFPISKPEIISVMLDAQGKELATDSGYGADDYMMPGQTAYVSSIISDPPAFKSLKFEVVARKATYRPNFAEGLVVEPAETAVKNGRYTFSGKVHNNGKTRARFLSVHIVALDAEKKLLGMTQTYAKTDGLEPGGEARYSSLSVAYEATPEQFVTTVSGRVVD